jgi:5-methyltetrahydrofolate--homocysteine methyltransferase
VIGGATTSQKHTAVKIAPAYDGVVIHVKDASRSVPVVEKLTRADGRAELDRENRAAQAEERAAFGRKRERNLVSLEEARKRRFATDWAAATIDRPAFLGVRSLFEVPLEELVPYIDWSPFFMTWELKGKYPRIFNDPVVGEEARKLFDHAQELLAKLIADRSPRANGVYGFFAANADGDDIVVYTDESRDRERLRLRTLRQQWEREGQKDFRALADYIAPRDSGRVDYVGAFAVTAGLGLDAIVAKYKAEHDDYNAIMAEALADRLAEAFAEMLHERARRDWGHGLEEKATKQDLIDEKYRGIRPAPGYPACPEHTEKGAIWDLLDVEATTGMKLTESYAMWPAASVSGLYFAHPQARYFAVDMITKEQVEDYARRKGWTPAEAERWLAPNLGYDPS